VEVASWEAVDFVRLAIRGVKLARAAVRSSRREAFILELVSQELC